MGKEAQSFNGGVDISQLIFLTSMPLENVTVHFLTIKETGKMHTFLHAISVTEYCKVKEIQRSLESRRDQSYILTVKNLE